VTVFSIDNSTWPTRHGRRCSNALAEIGDPEAIRLIGGVFGTEGWHYRNYTSALLPRIKDPLSEEVIIRCWS